MIYNSFNEAYVDLLEHLLKEGTAVEPRKGGSLGGTKELLAMDFGIPSTMPLCTLAQRKMSYAFCMLEPLYLFTTQNDTDIADSLMAYAPNLKKLALNEETKRFDGNYGDRIHLSPMLGDYCYEESQLERCYKELKKDPLSRRAVLTVHNPVWDEVGGESKDIPCTLNLHFMIRGGKLLCFCTMRSNDVWYGTPHNVMMFTFLQRALAAWLGVEPGMYFHRANSFHIYDKHVEQAQQLLADPSLLMRSPEVTYPEFPTPEETYQRMKELRAWEWEARHNVPTEELTMRTDPLHMPDYECELIKAVTAAIVKARSVK